MKSNSTKSHQRLSHESTFPVSALWDERIPAMWRVYLAYGVFHGNSIRWTAASVAKLLGVSRDAVVQCRKRLRKSGLLLMTKEVHGGKRYSCHAPTEFPDPGGRYDLLTSMTAGFVKYAPRADVAALRQQAKASGEEQSRGRAWREHEDLVAGVQDELAKAELSDNAGLRNRVIDELVKLPGFKNCSPSDDIDDELADQLSEALGIAHEHYSRGKARAENPSGLFINRVKTAVAQVVEAHARTDRGPKWHSGWPEAPGSYVVMQNGLAFEAEFDNGHDYSAWKWPGGASVKRLPWRERDPG